MMETSNIKYEEITYKGSNFSTDTVMKHIGTVKNNDKNYM